MFGMAAPNWWHKQAIFCQLRTEGILRSKHRNKASIFLLFFLYAGSGKGIKVCGHWPVVSTGLRKMYNKSESIKPHRCRPHIAICSKTNAFLE